MKHHLLLYVGDQGEYAWLIRMLDNWSLEHPEVEFLAESIHANPAQAVQLRVTHLPALVFDGHIVAQGQPVTWVPGFLDQILSNLG